jgi:hypothetical protein
MYFESELPQDMQQLLDKWRKYTGGRDGMVLLKDKSSRLKLSYFYLLLQFQFKPH